MAKNKTAQVAHHSSIRSQSRDKRRKVDAISSEVLDDDDDHHLHDEDQDEDEDDNGLKEDDSTTATREREDSTTSTGIKIDQLGFEILDIIFSFFSTSSTKGFGGGASSNNSNNNNNNLASSNLQQQQDAGTLSHYENQLNLLNFCQVSKGFYVVARWVRPVFGVVISIIPPFHYLPTSSLAVYSSRKKSRTILWQVGRLCLRNGVYILYTWTGLGIELDWTGLALPSLSAFSRYTKDALYLYWYPTFHLLSLSSSFFPWQCVLVHRTFGKLGLPFSLAVHLLVSRLICMTMKTNQSGPFPPLAFWHDYPSLPMPSYMSAFPYEITDYISPASFQ